MAEKSGQAADKEADGRRFIPLLVFSCAINVAVGLVLVLASIERTEFGYTVRKLEGIARERAARASELEVERERLLSPYLLERRAAELGMRAARPGQIRRMGNAMLETVPR